MRDEWRRAWAFSARFTHAPEPKHHFKSIKPETLMHIARRQGIPPLLALRAHECRLRRGIAERYRARDLLGLKSRRDAERRINLRENPFTTDNRRAIFGAGR